MSRQPNRARSRRIVLAVVLFLLVVGGARNDGCGRPTPVATAGALATTGLLPRLMGAVTRALVLISQPGKANQATCR